MMTLGYLIAEASAYIGVEARPEERRRNPRRRKARHVDDFLAGLEHVGRLDLLVDRLDPDRLSPDENKSTDVTNRIPSLEWGPPVVEGIVESDKMIRESCGRLDRVLEAAFGRSGDPLGLGPGCAGRDDAVGDRHLQYVVVELGEDVEHADGGRQTAHR